MSEIKVGDKVRVVQIIVKEHGDRGFQSRRVEYLGCEGEVTNVMPPGFPRIIVLLPEFDGVVAFSPRELKVLSSPCEQLIFTEFWHKSDRTKRRLRNRVEELRRRLDACVAERSELKETEEKLRESLAGKIAFIGRLQTRIREIREAHRSVRSEVLLVINKVLDIR